MHEQFVSYMPMFNFSRTKGSLMMITHVGLRVLIGSLHFSLRFTNTSKCFRRLRFLARDKVFANHLQDLKINKN